MPFQGFDLATTTDVVGSAVALGPDVVTWCIKFAFTFGGAAFTGEGTVASGSGGG